MPVITFHTLVTGFTIKNKKPLKAFIAKLFSAENKSLASLSYIFCDDKYLLQLNKSFLNHDTYTDIITFTLSGSESAIKGDIYISIDRVKENASHFNASFQFELHRVIFHGALHLCGYQDKSKKQKQEIREKENLYLAQYFVPRETI